LAFLAWGLGSEGSMGRGHVVVRPTGPANAGPQSRVLIDTRFTITVGGELEEGRAFFGTDAVREFVSP